MIDQKDEKGVRYMGRHDLVGGEVPTHYAQGISPVSYIRSHGMDFCAGNVVKYITRYQLKGHAKEDLLKCRSYLDMLIADFGGE